MEFTKQPYLQLPTTDGMTVLWETVAPGDTLIRIWKCYIPSVPDTYNCEYRIQGEPRESYGEAGLNHRVGATGLFDSWSKRR